MQHPRRVAAPSAAEDVCESRPDSRARILLVETDELTRWSVATYLKPWFVVDVAESLTEAEAVVPHRSYAALVLSGALDPRRAAEVQHQAARQNPALMTVRTVTHAGELPPGEPRTVQIEKPFELASLARLLGVENTDTSSR